MVRSQRVPNLKTAQTCVAFQDRGRASVKKKPASRSDRGAGIGRVPCLQNFGLRAPDHALRRSEAQRDGFENNRVLESRHTPADNHRFERAAGFMIAPLAVGVVAFEWQLICPALVLTQHLDRQTRRRHAGAIEFR